MNDDTINQLKRNVLLLFSPATYPGGVEVNLDEFKPKVVAALRGLAQRGYCEERTMAAGRSHVQLTEKGCAIIGD